MAYMWVSAQMPFLACVKNLEFDTQTALAALVPSVFHDLTKRGFPNAVYTLGCAGQKQAARRPAR